MDFFQKPIEAFLARKFGNALLRKGAEAVNMKSFRYYDRMLPIQDSLPQGGLGNLIALPLQGQALKEGNSAFVDENWNAYPEQWEIFDKDGEKPWERSKHFAKQDVDGKIQIVLANAIYIDASNLKPRIQNQIRGLAAFPNPVFFKNQAMGLSNFENTRYIYLGKDEDGYIKVPRGLLENIVSECSQAGIEYRIEDKRCAGRVIKAAFNGQLKVSQIPAVERLIQSETGILNAATAFGKTVVCYNVIARKKKRKSVIGRLQGPHDSTTGIIDIAMVGSIYRGGEYHKRLQEYGLVIVDECHHAASDTMVAVLQEVKAKYVYGVTATPLRGDKLEKINEMLLGPIRYRYTSKERAKEQGIAHLVYPRFTRAVAAGFGQDKMHPNDAYEIVRNNEDRDNLIISDVKQCIADGRTQVVLSKYVNHSERLYKQLENHADKIFLLSGKNSKKEHREILQKMGQVNAAESMILVATGKLIGEGFDYPRLDTLIMATPVAGKSVVEQYAGRLNRDYEGKKNVIIYDYVDSHIPMFDRMYGKRLKAYRQIGYEIYSEKDTEKQETNAIFDLDNYFEVYKRDLLEANREIIISSPAISAKKVEELMLLLKEKQESGLRTVIVTWRPDRYGYGDSEYWMELQERMHRFGFEMNLIEDYCEHYCIVDREIVWYGSMNFLGKEDAEDNLMRVASKGIAAELLELTFGSGGEKNERIFKNNY